jgi:ATP-dependent RNA helicase RhlE
MCPKITCIASAEPPGPGAAGTVIAFCSDEERPYLRDIEKLTRCSLRTLPLATLAPGGGPIGRPAKAKLPWEGRLASRQAPENGRAARSRHLPRPAGAEIRQGGPPAKESFQHSRAARRQPNLVR